ncbi:MAG: hypothetical protein A3G32_07495 [Deltaproteobacteria bacterium RIFCSPLOWO2_12_FULL_40_28]|nr:MAG: hypothetical protein A3C45_08170 [Deltaproteobacteria bacterium RIFCSPHIGHO2_02_FULL_40_28]OGQ20325.1 MAG: hypothetical protein A3E27_00035 [Deltaproteobacteria bacterium RIFCSPHIGHO2_12_FULL_40_32]OGQ40782.1 MAG: hypothetical protein A3I69_06715 [Deltaproteobacteria bacterium RIFCSPLOWO2_02_FULL_40_36]OGQ54932.1 MAG: hypothetical protein A3G32_07495 [Deltaproteobacteria bacterium RIFCSPLOWO2_12_FULL_40_28]
MLSQAFKQTLAMRIFTFFKIPLLSYCKPWVVKLEPNYCEAVIPLNKRTRNHVKSLYFGALAIGADMAAGAFLMDTIRRSGQKVGFIFKDFTADFLKLAKSDVHFICTEGKKVRAVVQKTIQTKKRANTTVNIIAKCPKASGDDIVARFTLTISVKALPL